MAAPHLVHLRPSLPSGRLDRGVLPQLLAPVQGPHQRQQEAEVPSYRPPPPDDSAGRGLHPPDQVSVHHTVQLAVLDL